mmetsp:Transcript_2984/g.4593  ORF Transcript_2984/g.4593 Transcript_2984/m.4593 type:complete len:162 (-) Transcript_2984:234-719(-)
MSTIDATAMKYCASCGIGEEDGVKLKDCSACKSVRYCGVDCQKKHRPKHKKECKNRTAELNKKSAADLHDDILFQQPPKAAILVTVPSVACHYPLIEKNIQSQAAAIKQSARPVRQPARHVRWIIPLNKNAHFVDSPSPMTGGIAQGDNETSQGGRSRGHA